MQKNKEKVLRAPTHIENLDIKSKDIIAKFDNKVKLYPIPYENIVGIRSTGLRGI